jgi:drug/metabolite transporter (DMT)-like permease
MIYLILSILSSTTIFIVFKLFERFRVPVLQAIVVNYFVAFITGFLFYWSGRETPMKSIPEMIDAGWFYYTLLLGTLFILVFKLMAITTQRIGLSVVSVATKMSVVIPIMFGLIYYKEEVGFLKLGGIIAALLSVYLVSLKNNSAIKLKRGFIFIPMLVFLGSGVIDTSLKILEETYVAQDDVSLFSSVIFLAAAIVGVLLLLIQYMIKKYSFEGISLIGGMALGLPNFLTIYFLVMALRSDLFDSSGIFTVNNVAIVALSTLVGILFFRERLKIKNWIGIVLALLSILLMFLSV